MTVQISTEASDTQLRQTQPGAAYAPPVLPAGHLEGRRWSYASSPFLGLDHSFRIQTDDVGLDDYLDAVFAEFTVPGPAATVYSLLDRQPRRSGRYALYAGDDRLILSNTLSRVIGTLLWHVNQEVVRLTAPRLVLWHAAAAERDGVGVVLPAEMESGKTTTVAGLVRAGYRYLTDETVAVDPDTLLIQPWPKALSVDEGSWPVLPDLEPPWRPVHDQWQVPPRRVRPDAVAAAVRPRLMITPRYERDAATRLEPLARAEALIMLAQSTFEFAERAERNLQVGARVLAGCECYRLVIGDLDTAVRLVDGLVDDVRANRRGSR